MGAGFEFGSSTWWSAERAVPIHDAVDQVLDALERRVDRDDTAWDLARADLAPPLSTGVGPFDVVLGGGVRPGTVTVVEADVLAQGQALLYSVARSISHRTLIDGQDVLTTAAWLLAGSAGLPGISVIQGCLSEREWRAFADGISPLANQDLAITSTGSIGALEAVTRSSGPEVLLVGDTERFGAPGELLRRLLELALDRRVAVIAVMGCLDDGQEWALDGIGRVTMQGYDFGGRASLVRPDPLTMLAVAQVEVQCLSGVVT